MPPPLIADPGTADDVSLTVVPPRLGDDYNLIAKPGETLQTSVEVRNSGEAPVVVETFIKDFIIDSTGSQPLPVNLEQANPRWQMSQWVTLTPNTNVIEPRGSATVIVTITVPETPLPGGRYAMILHRPVVAESGTVGSGAQISVQAGTLLYLIVDGALVEKANIDEFKIPKLLETGPVPFNIRLRNDSSYHLQPALNITITNIFGRQVENQTLEALNVFPDSSRDFSGEWKKTWGFGPYTATVNGTYGLNLTDVGAQKLTASTTFWLIPWKIIILVGIILAVLLLIILSSRRKYRQLLEAEEEKVRKLDEKLQQVNQTITKTSSKSTTQS